MPPRDPRLCPDLERALPADSEDAADYRVVREPREILFGDGEWRQVELRAVWRDRAGRWVVKVEWSAADDRWQGSYLAEPEKIRRV